VKTVILAGGFGTRISEETSIMPKPMVQIGHMPILWHIMKMYSSYGHNDFIICCGYKGHVIKKFFSDYFLRKVNVTFDLKNNSMEVLSNNVEPWKVTLIDTGEDTMTGGRLKRVQEYVGNERFFLTYGDGVSDINFDKLTDFHRRKKTLATLTAVQPPGRFGAFNLEQDSDLIENFREKPKGEVHGSAWINAGFFVLEPEVFDYIKGDQTIWEREPLESFANENQLSAYRHTGYWQNMDTLHDKNVLDKIWKEGNPLWKNW
jgi:glucose-1-phosphate cytidylyltransferase